MEKLRFKTNIHCGGCIKSVTPHLNQLDEVSVWKVDVVHPENILEVEIEEGAASQVIEAVRQAGFEIELLP